MGRRYKAVGYQYIYMCVCVCVCLGVRVVMTLYYLGNVEVRSDEFRRVFLNPRVG